MLDNQAQEALIQTQKLSAETADLRDQFCASQNLNSVYATQIQQLQQQVDELNITNDANEHELGYLLNRNFQLQQEMHQLLEAHNEELSARYLFVVVCLLLSFVVFRQRTYEINLEIERNRALRLQHPPRTFTSSPFPRTT